jgi:hypothetical protein
LKDFAIFLIQENQLQKGVNEDNKIIGLYSQATEFLSGGLKTAGTPYNLNDTGCFYESMFVKSFFDYIEIIADGQKDNENILLKFSEKIIGLSENSKQALSLALKPYFIENVKKYLLKTIIFFIFV